MGDCVRINSNTLVKVEENKRKATFRNPQRKEFRVGRIDDCLVKSGIRSDYFVLEPGTGTVLIELKGTDVAHACAQLFASAEHPTSRLKSRGR